MRAWKTRERRLASVALTVIAGAVVVEAVLLPQWSSYTRARDEAASKEASLEQMRANLRLKDQIEAGYEQMKGMIRESGTASQEMSRFARLLTELYGPLRLQTRSVRPLPDEDQGFYRKFALSLEMEGTVGELTKFLAASARASDPIRIERLELNCKDRPDYVVAQLVVTKVTTTSRPAGGMDHGGRPSNGSGLFARRGVP